MYPLYGKSLPLTSLYSFTAQHTPPRQTLLLPVLRPNTIPYRNYQKSCMFLRRQFQKSAIPQSPIPCQPNHKLFQNLYLLYIWGEDALSIANKPTITNRTIFLSKSVSFIFTSSLPAYYGVDNIPQSRNL